MTPHRRLVAYPLIAVACAVLWAGLFFAARAIRDLSTTSRFEVGIVVVTIACAAIMSALPLRR